MNTTMRGIASAVTVLVLCASSSLSVAAEAFTIINDDFVLDDRDLVIRDSANRVLFRLDAQSGDLRIQDAGGDTVVLIQRKGRNISLGGNGRAGDLVLLPRTATNQDLSGASVHLDGSNGTQTLGGGGTVGKLVLRDGQGRQRIAVNGGTATITLGQDGRDGDIEVRNANGQSTVTVDGANGRVRADEFVSDGNVRVAGKVSSAAFTSNSPLIFEAPSGTERARIDDATGNFGIGTQFPGRRLHVLGDVLIQSGELLCASSEGIRQSCIDERNIGFGVVPIGAIIAWHPDLPGVPSLTEDWAECNGQVITEQKHPGSPLVNTTLPDLNGDARFLRGGRSSGELQEEEVGSHRHKIDTHTSGVNETHVNQGSSGAVKGQALTKLDLGKENRPINMSVVWIMRVR